MVEKNFKHTEIGLIPEDWEVGTFGDFMEGFSSGMTPYRGNKEFYKGDIPWITSGELNYNIIEDTFEKITPDAVFKTNLKVIPQGTFLMAITGLEAEGTRGSCAITGIEATTNQSCMALYPHKDKLLTSYLYHFYVRYGKELALRYCQGTKQQSYNAVVAKKLPIVFPSSLPEQQAIAETLTHTDEWIESLEKLIAKKRLLKQGAMQQLLTPGEDWKVKKLGEVVTITSGESPSKFKFVENGIPYLKVDELNNAPKYTTALSYFIETEKYIPKGSIIFPKRGASIFLNKIRILKENSFMDTNLMTLTVSKEVNNEFLFYSLNYFGLDSITDTTSIPQINNKHINPLELPFPTKTEQTHIANILSDMDSEIEALEQKLAKAKQIKQGMMQELLTGRIRLIESDTQSRNHKPKKATVNM